MASDEAIRKLLAIASRILARRKAAAAEHRRASGLRVVDGQQLDKAS